MPKIEHFTKKGMHIEGVVHIGTNWGEEIPGYVEMGIKNIIGFEPLTEAYNECVVRHLPFRDQGIDIKLFPYAIGNTNSMERITETRGSVKPEHPIENTGGSTMLAHKSLGPEWTTKDILIPVKKYITFLSENPEIDMTKYNCIVIDTEGMELEVLKSMESHVRDFDMFNIECSEKAIYVGQPDGQVVIDYLKQYNIEQDCPMIGHDDVMFIRR